MSQKERNADILPRASSSDFESIDLSSLLATLKNADVLTIESALRDELREVNESGNDSPVKALVLLITF